MDSFNARLNRAGSLAANCVAIQPDGKIIVGGAFDTAGGQSRTSLARLNADGTLDRGFNPGAKRTLYYEPRMEKQDYEVIVFLLLLLALALYLRLGLAAGAVLPGRL